MNLGARTALAVGVVAAGLLAAGVAFASPAPTAKPAKPKTTVVTVSMFEMGFKLGTTTVPRGTVVFKVVNDGQIPHDFSFGKLKTPLLESGQSAALVARFSKPGKFTYICTVEGHAGAGMIGALTVK